MNRSRYGIVGFALVTFFVLFSSNAFADSNGREFEAIGSVSAIELRGFAGLTPSLTSPGVLGGDAQYQLEVAPFAVEFGGRIGTDASARDLSMVDVGLHLFPDDTAKHALFVGGGGFYGNEYVHGFKLRTASLAGIYGEVGYETPRDKDLRAVASLRVDLGYAAKRDAVTVPAFPLFTTATFNLGVLYAGKNTRARRSASDPIF